jgi:hypothetical protein
LSVGVPPSGGLRRRNLKPQSEKDRLKPGLQTCLRHFFAPRSSHLSHSPSDFQAFWEACPAAQVLAALTAVSPGLLWRRRNGDRLADNVGHIAEYRLSLGVQFANHKRSLLMRCSRTLTLANLLKKMRQKTLAILAGFFE